LPRPLHRARPVAVLLLLLALVATACGSDDKTSAAAADTTAPTVAAKDLDLSGVTLRVGDLGGTQKAGLAAAGESDTPYKIEWSQFPSGPPAIEAINAGAVDLSIMGDTPPIFAAAGGVDTKIVAVARPKVDTNPYLQILVPEGSAIKSVADLKGKSVAVAQQTILEYFLRRALTKVHLDIADVKPAYLQPADAQAAYTSGKADAFVSIEPLTTITNGVRKSRAIASSSDYFISQTLAVARGKALADPKVSAAIGDYLQRVVRTYQWEQAHIDEWVPIYVKTTKFPQALAAATIASTAVAWQPIDADVLKVQQDQIDTWSKAGAVPSGLKAEDEFDNRFNTLIKEVAK
jgi:sulfonate transport system substrate-binding protein